MSEDRVDHPRHYGSHPSGVECIEIVEHMDFNLGNAIKYIFRREDKGKYLEDLKKSKWYVDREVQLLLDDNRGWAHYVATSRIAHRALQDASRRWLDAEPPSDVRSAFHDIMTAHNLMSNYRMPAITHLMRASEHLNDEIVAQEPRVVVEK